MAPSPLHHLSALGESVWIDYISRDLLCSGRCLRAVAQHVNDRRLRWQGDYVDSQDTHVLGPNRGRLSIARENFALLGVPDARFANGNAKPS